MANRATYASHLETFSSSYALPTSVAVYACGVIRFGIPHSVLCSLCSSWIWWRWLWISRC